jgi:hypothetical protein
MMVWESDPSPRGFCACVDFLSDALFRLTIDGSAENVEAQFWFSVYGFSTAIVSQIEPRWSAELTRILA